jgi:hypothetical protein
MFYVGVIKYSKIKEDNYVGMTMDVKLEQPWNAAEDIWYKDVDRNKLCIRRLDSKAPLKKKI